MLRFSFLLFFGVGVGRSEVTFYHNHHSYTRKQQQQQHIPCVSMSVCWFECDTQRLQLLEWLLLRYFHSPQTKLKSTSDGSKCSCVLFHCPIDHCVYDTKFVWQNVTKVQTEYSCDDELVTRKENSVLTIIVHSCAIFMRKIKIQTKNLPVKIHREQKPTGTYTHTHTHTETDRSADPTHSCIRANNKQRVKKWNAKRYRGKVELEGEWKGKSIRWSEWVRDERGDSQRKHIGWLTGWLGSLNGKAAQSFVQIKEN